MHWFSHIFARPNSVLMARNALLAEHELRQVELVPENRLARLLATTIDDLLRSQGERLSRFNSANRLTQLNIVARAFHQLRQDPSLRGEAWTPAVLVSANDLLQRLALEWLGRTLGRQHGVTITIPERRLQIVDGILTDPA
jgi:hypothetical protein